MPHSEVDDEEFQAKQDVRTLVEAEEIKSDKARMKRAKKMAAEKMEALKKVKA